jgi:hypothetical protein
MTASKNASKNYARSPQDAYAALSLKDLLDARDQYHIHLMRMTNVVATAVGYYRIRTDDSWPGDKPVVHGNNARTLLNSQVRPYSWPAVLVFVEEWINATEFGAQRKYDVNTMVPETLYLPDGRRVPVCVIEAPKEVANLLEPEAIRYPLNNIGSGHPVLVEVQNREHFATVACLATDGHKTYALTNRHVTGDEGQEIRSQLGGKETPIGVSAAGQATRIVFSEIYPGWPGRMTYVNLDVGLIDVTNLDQWTARLKNGEIMGPMVDLSSIDFPLSLIGRRVQGYGAATQEMLGEIHGLFYRYKSRGGFEYVADFFIGPRTPTDADPHPPAFVTQAGDSGTLWLLEPDTPETDNMALDGGKTEAPRPLAMQWGANRLYSALSARPQAYALATCLSTVCDLLDLDLVRDWNLDQPDTWGAVGHFAIASRVVTALSGAVPTLSKLMQNNALVISHDDNTILTNAFKNMGKDAVIPMADVPDFFWKHGSQGYSRAMEGPNHFADMDQPRPGDGVDLLTLCQDTQQIDANVWNTFYDSVKDLLNDTAVTPQHRGLLPFRVWQIFDAMVGFVKSNLMPEFICAAGVLTHYVGDSCQPLHISYLFDGDPRQFTVHTVHHINGTTSDTHIALGAGVHSAYEDTMVNTNRKEILDGLDNVPGVQKTQYVKSGFEAAVATVALMRDTIGKIDPDSLIQKYLQIKTNKSNVADEMWTDFGEKTIEVMQAGTHLLGVLWESAWVLGGGEDGNRDTSAIDPGDAMKICEPASFLPSYSIDQIGAVLLKPGNVPNGASNGPSTPSNGNGPAPKKKTAKKSTTTKKGRR